MRHGGDDIEFTLRVLPVGRRARLELLPAGAVRIEGLAGMVRGRRRPGREQRRARPPRRRLAAPGAGVHQAVPAVDRRSAGGGGAGAAGGARGGALQQRGAAKHQRRAGDHQGGAAVVQRGADDRQRAVPQPQPRARRADRRSLELHQQRRSADGDRGPRSAHPAADAGGAAGLQPAAHRRRPLARTHQVLARRSTRSAASSIG